MPVEVCKPTSKTQCFEWQRSVCDMKPASVVTEVRWENEMLDQNDTETRAKEGIRIENYCIPKSTPALAYFINVSHHQFFPEPFLSAKW